MNNYIIVMKKALIVGRLCLILSLILLGSCQNNETFNSSQDVHTVKFSFRGIDPPLNSSLNEFTDFHLHITNTEGATASYKNFENIESIPEIEIKQGSYQVLMVANAKPEIFKIPEFPLTSQSIISLQPTASSISELCLGNKPLTVTEDINNELELTLKRIVGKINVSVENAPQNTDNIQIRINNMFNSVQLNGTYPDDITTCTFDLAQDENTNSFSAQGIILFPTNGNINITYTITNNEGQNKVYTQTLNEALHANGSLNITTSLSDIVRHVTPKISLKLWDETIDIKNMIVIGQDEDDKEESNINKIAFNGLPDDFTPTKLSITCKNTSNQLLPTTEADISSEITIKTPNGASKLMKATFTNASNDSFAVYFGKTGTEGITLQNIITLPNAPTLGSYYAGGIIINQQRSGGYLAYKCTAISTDIWKNTKWGENFGIGAKATNDAKANNSALIAKLEGTGWTIKSFPAFNACRNYRGGGYDDWYFATVPDLTTAYSIYQSSPESFNNLIAKYATTNPLDFNDDISYITSTEVKDNSMDQCCGVKFPCNGNSNEKVTKSNTTHNVCAVRYL